MRQTSYSAKRVVNAYAVLAAASARTLTNAKDSREGQYYNIMASMLFSAFSLEAYLNHLGSKVQTGWDIVHRKLSTGQKLDLLSKVIGYTVDTGHRPFQTFGAIFKFRNAIVHAKPFSAQVSEGWDVASPDVPPELKAPWERLMTLDQAQRFYDDALDMVDALQQRAFDESVDWTLQGTVGWGPPPSTI